MIERPRLVGIAAWTLRQSCRSRARAFRRALAEPNVAQQRLLQALIREAAGTEYGRSLGLSANDDMAAFRAKLPVVSYQDLLPWVEREKSGQYGSLTVGSMRCFEKTSGSAGAAKYIPYTRGLLGSFQSVFRIWAYDLLTHVVRPRSGKFFASVSPNFRDERATASGTPIGLEDDADYLPATLRRLIRPFLVAPAGLKRLTDPDDFRDVLAASLITESKLEIISVWNPSLLLILLDHFADHRDRLLPALRSGRMARGGRIFRFSPLAFERQRLLEQEPISWGQVWPQLQLISCWTSAAARRPAARLHALFPDVFLQGKGLLATEAPISVPLVRAPDCVPLIDEVFLEFDDDSGRIRLLHEIEAGESYRLILSQKGGLLRYRLGDRVRVTGRFHSTPCLEFLGREDGVCDMVGEKLNEAFVRQVLEALVPDWACSMLVPVQSDDICRYFLLTDRADDPLLAERLDARLQQAFHYRNARLLGQLGAVRVIAAKDMPARIHDFFIEDGMRWGDIKDRFLVTDITQAERLINSISHSRSVGGVLDVHRSAAG